MGIMRILHSDCRGASPTVHLSGPVEALSGWSGNMPGNDSEIVDIASYIH